MLTAMLTVMVTLFLVFDPIGNVPMWLSVLQRVPPQRREWVIFRECLLALGVLVFFLVAGREALSLLGVEGAAVRIAGGVVIFLIALRMIFPPVGGTWGPAHGGPTDEAGAAVAAAQEPFLVPLAVPLMAGPSAIATLMLFAQSGRFALWQLGLMMLAAWAASTAILCAAGPISRLLGPRGLTAAERLMGMLLVMIAVQMVLSGIDQHLLGLPPVPSP